MRAKYYLVLLAILSAVFFLHNCKIDKPIAPPGSKDPDSLYVGTPYLLQQPPLFPPMVLPPDNPITAQGVQLGRMLFYDPVLSSDSVFSCSSCHHQQFAFSDAGKALSTNFFGLTKRNTPGLFNLIWEKSYFMDGRADSLTQQIQDAMQNEMNFIAGVSIPKLQAKPVYVSLFKKAFGRPGTVTEANIHKAIAQFLMSLISCNSKFDSVLLNQEQFTASELRGFNLFQADTIAHGGDCFHCHADNSSSAFFLMEDNRFHNNALDSSNSFAGFPDLGRGAIDGNFLDNGKFKTPHFRNLGLTGPYMRDGRFTTLAQVVNFYNDSLKESPTVDPFMKTAYRGGLHYLNEQNKQDLVNFILTMTDYQFVNNPAYSNPFK